jgi:glycosyltransferase involved in cell wall biosynthesis
MREKRPVVISVVIALLNGGATLRRALDSVVQQEYAERELIVMDGGSTDGSVDILRGYASSIAYWESQSDRGLYHAFNKALGRVRGEWIYFLGADDYLWDERVLSAMAPRLASAYPPHRVVYGRANFMSERGEILEVLGKPWEEFRRMFVQGFMIPHQAVFHHRSLFEVHGRFNETFRTSGDYEMLLRELKSGPALFVPEVVVAGYQFGGGSSAPRNTLVVLKERRRAWKLNGVKRVGLSWYVAEARALLRAALWAVLGERLAKRVLDMGRAVLGKPPLWTRI